MMKSTINEIHIPITDFLNPVNFDISPMCEDIRKKFYSNIIPKPASVSVFINELIPSQDTIFTSNLEKINTYTTLYPILIVDYQCRLYIADGHHRAYSAAQRGQKTIGAYVVKVSIEMRPNAF